MTQIGKAGAPVSHISQAYPDRVEVRGRDLTGDLMGRLSFTEYFHLLLTGREPTEDQRFFLDLLLVAIAEHGMMPTNVAARMTLAADPGSLQGAVAAGILGCGPVILGTAEECARLLERGAGAGRRRRRRRPRSPRDDRAARSTPPASRLPGFGHPVHRPLDPRAERILELADARGVSGPHVALARAFRDAVAEAWGRPLTMNVSMPIAAVMLDLGFPPPTVKAVPILARTAGLLAHLAEEQRAADRLPDGRRGRGGGRRTSAGVMLDARGRDAPVGRAARARRRGLPRAARLPARALGLLPREARRRGLDGRASAGGLDGDRAAAAHREAASCGRPVTPENPIGAHLCAARDEIVRIYSTSGTTGTPSYIPLTAGDLDNWVDRLGAQLRRLRRRAPAQRIVSTYNAGPVRRRRGARARSTASASATSRSAPATPSG